SRGERRLDVHHALSGQGREDGIGQALEVGVAVEEAALPHPALDELVEAPVAEAGPELGQGPERRGRVTADPLEEPGEAHGAVEVEVELDLGGLPDGPPPIG